MQVFVIVGAGECGTRAAFALRDAGFEGSVILIGDEPHLPYERPPLSKALDAGPTIIADREKFKAAGIEFLQGVTVSNLDRSVREIVFQDGRRLFYDKLLLATGASPRVFPGLERAQTFRTLDDAATVHDRLAPGKRLLVVGGGFIGLELAAAACTAGVEVIVIEAADRTMSRIVPTEIAAVAEAAHRERGVTFVLGTGVVSADERQVTLADGRVLEGDLVIAGVGAVPNTRLAETGGLAIDNGIVVDEHFATSDSSIFAAGDCCCFPYRGSRVRLESWRAALDQANHAAACMLGGDEPYGKVPWFWSDQYDLTLQVAGLPGAAARSVRRDCEDGAFIHFELDRDGELFAASGIGIGNTVAKDIRLAELLISRRVAIETDALADPAVNLKKLLRG